MLSAQSVLPSELYSGGVALRPVPSEPVATTEVGTALSAPPSLSFLLPCLHIMSAASDVIMELMTEILSELFEARSIPAPTAVSNFFSPSAARDRTLSRCMPWKRVAVGVQAVEAPDEREFPLFVLGISMASFCPPLLGEKPASGAPALLTALVDPEPLSSLSDTDIVSTDTPDWPTTHAPWDMD